MASTPQGAGVRSVEAPLPSPLAWTGTWARANGPRPPNPLALPYRLNAPLSLERHRHTFRVGRRHVELDPVVRKGGHRADRDDHQFVAP